VSNRELMLLVRVCQTSAPAMSEHEVIAVHRRVFIPPLAVNEALHAQSTPVSNADRSRQLISHRAVPEAAFMELSAKC
jgi:hypothetical protein